MGNPMYRLPINRHACYVIELYAGCDYCATPPGVVVHKVDRSSIFWNELQDAPLLPLHIYDDHAEATIMCGLDPDEFRKEATAQMKGTEVDGGKIDETLADIIAEDLWKDVLRRLPRIIGAEPKTRAAMGKVKQGRTR
jgi:hypothetical protein